MIGTLFRILAWDPRTCVRNLRSLGWFRRQRRELGRQAAASGRGGEFPFARPVPILHERFEESGTASGHYFHQDLLVARRILAANPRRHLDVGSRVDGFVAHVAVFRPIEVIDIRDLRVAVPNIRFVQADIMGDLPGEFVACCDSLSCLHALEHFGLGRYGDPVDFLGHERALANLAAILEPGGTLYLSVPMGPQRIEFNAHRVFAAKTVLDLLAGSFVVRELSYVDDEGRLHEDVPRDEAGLGANFGCTWGCLIVEAEKRR